MAVPTDVVIAREMAVTGLRIAAIAQGVSIPADTLGKWKMGAQVTTILLLGVLSAVLVAFGGMLGPGYLYFFTGLAVTVGSPPR